MLGRARRVLWYHINDADNRLSKLEQKSREDTLMLLLLYEALLAATSEPGQPFTAAQKARDILALAGENPEGAVEILAAEAAGE